MRKFWLHIALLPLALIALGGCNRQPAAQEATGSYTVRVSIAPGVKTDSVALYLVSDDYGRLLHVPATGKSNGGRVWTFSGQMTDAQIALLRVAGAKKPLRLIVEPCLTEVGVNETNTVVWGGKLNHYYLAQSARIDSMQAELRQLRLTYNRALADSSLTSQGEASIIANDKRTYSACQHLLVRLMRRPDAVGRLVRDQHFAKLDSASMSKL